MKTAHPPMTVHTPGSVEFPPDGSVRFVGWKLNLHGRTKDAGWQERHRAEILEVCGRYVARRVERWLPRLVPDAAEAPADIGVLVAAEREFAGLLGRMRASQAPAPRVVGEPPRRIFPAWATWWGADDSASEAARARELGRAARHHRAQPPRPVATRGLRRPARDDRRQGVPCFEGAAMTTAMTDNPTERQLALAFIAALRKKARQPGPVPDYIPRQPARLGAADEDTAQLFDGSRAMTPSNWSWE